MYQIGDFVVHSGHGLCSVLEVHTEESSYYRLETYHNKMLITLPMDKAPLFLRPILSKTDVFKALNDSVLLSEEYIKDNKERKIQFQQLVTSNNIMDTLHLLKMIYHIAEDRRLEKKTLGSFDTQFLQQAERKLFNEVAVATGITKDEAQAVVCERLKSQLVY
ncbi:MAG: hypothetical protein K2M08_03485 [Anaeroplasmataceae bacterium]|nr:hypothetical protein [Anaeroplasmataceae bacterium]MDE6241469.1 hypothetical protein [Anaeroplasmataceae bacterium]